MYSSKRFKPRPEAEILADIERVARLGNAPTKIFLADGDALVLSMRRLRPILQTIKEKLPNTRRISAYALPSNLNRKSKEELDELKALGLTLIYVGIESGDDQVLGAINKSETSESTRLGLIKARQAGIKTSVMIINGLGGKQYSKQHAVNSAHLLNQVQPEYASILTLMLPRGDARFQEGWQHNYQAMNQEDLLRETALFLEHTELEQTIFRTDHASNYLVLKGTLGRDKTRLLLQIDQALETPEHLRPEWSRGL